MSTRWRVWEETDEGLLVGGVKGQDGVCGVEDGIRVDVDLDVAGTGLGGGG